MLTPRVGSLLPGMPPVLDDRNVGVVALVANMLALALASALTRHPSRGALNDISGELPGANRTTGR
jgi:hypothetical protein